MPILIVAPASVLEQWNKYLIIKIIKLLIFNKREFKKVKKIINVDYLKFIVGL